MSIDNGMIEPGAILRLDNSGQISNQTNKPQDFQLFKEFMKDLCWIYADIYAEKTWALLIECNLDSRLINSLF